MAENIVVGTHTQELIDMRPETKEIVEKTVSRSTAKAFFATKDERSGVSRYETLLLAAYENMLRDPSKITPDMLKFLTEQEKKQGGSADLLAMFVDLNQVPESIKEVVAKGGK